MLNMLWLQSLIAHSSPLPIVIMQSNCALASAFIGGKGTYIAIDTVLA